MFGASIPVGLLLLFCCCCFTVSSFLLFFTIHYTIEMQLLGSLAPIFLFVYKCGYLRALTIYVWSEHSLWDFVVLAVVVFVVSSSFLLSFYWLLVGVFRKGF